MTCSEARDPARAYKSGNTLYDHFHRLHHQDHYHHHCLHRHDDYHLPLHRRPLCIGVAMQYGVVRITEKDLDDYGLKQLAAPLSRAALEGLWEDVLGTFGDVFVYASWMCFRYRGCVFGVLGVFLVMFKSNLKNDPPPCQNDGRDN